MPHPPRCRPHYQRNPRLHQLPLRQHRLDHLVNMLLLKQSAKTLTSEMAILNEAGKNLPFSYYELKVWSISWHGIGDETNLIRFRLCRVLISKSTLLSPF